MPDTPLGPAAELILSIEPLRSFAVLGKLLRKHPPASSDYCGMSYRMLVPDGERRDTLPVEAAIHAATVASFLFDDIMDADERKPDFGIDEGRRANLGGALLVATYKLIAGSDFPPDVQIRIVGEISDLLLEASAGQEIEASIRDGDRPNDDPEATYWKVIQAKSSQQVGRNLRLGCIMAGRPDMEERFFEIGMALGDMLQILDDVSDALYRELSPDWRATGINLLIIFCLHPGNPQRERFARLFEHATSDREAHRECREVMIRSGAVGFAIHHFFDRFLKTRKRIESLEGLDTGPLLEALHKPVRPLAAGFKELGIEMPAEIAGSLRSFA